MDAVITEVAEEAKRLIDRTWLGELSRDDAVHRFVQVSDGLVGSVTARDIIDDGVRWLDANATRLRILGWCSLFEVLFFGGIAVVSLMVGDYLSTMLGLVLLLALQVAHRKLVPHPTPIRRAGQARY